jgi:hypothetical protein
MKANSKYLKKGFIPILLTFVIFTTSCYKDPPGRDGRPGKAFLSLTYEYEEPTYLDAGTGDIPPVFKWGEFYRAYPGWYTLYYEGEHWTGSHWAFYAWEVDYEIWENPGEPGGYHYNGRNGADNYFTLECSPFGPYSYSNYKKQKSTDFIIESESYNEIVIRKDLNDFSMRIKYKRKIIN